MDGGSEKLSRYVGKSLPKGNVELVLYSVWAGEVLLSQGEVSTIDQTDFLVRAGVNMERRQCLVS